MSQHRKSDGTTTITGADGKIATNVASNALKGPGLPPAPIVAQGGESIIELTGRIEQLTHWLTEEGPKYYDDNPRVKQTQMQIEKAQRLRDYLEYRASFGVPEDAEDCRLSGGHRKDWFAKKEIVRNPDGTTNVWVRKYDDNGDVEFLPVVGVEVKEDITGKTGNALVTADGDEHIEWGYWENGRPVRHNVLITVAPAADGAYPLVDEGDPDAAFHLPSH